MNAVLLHSREIAPQVKHFVFEVPELERLDFMPGQFASLSADLGGRRITRAYSIASPPSGNCFELCLNRVADGIFSPYLFRLQPGDSVEMQPPLGFFTLRNPDHDMLMVATGTGVAPYRAMLMDYLGRGGKSQTTLLFGARYEPGLLYRVELEAFERRHATFHFWPTLSRPDSAWTGRIGHVQAHLDSALDGRTNLDVYVCGLKAMVDDIRARLKSRGLDRKQIIYEKYD
ncbi:MAG: oxidoreductase [Acidobacteriia bacterium]|nr:oxidoreductase [Terriglobia bacterium]